MRFDEGGAMARLVRRLGMVVAWTVACSASTLPACGSMGGMRGMLDAPAASQPAQT